MVLVQRDSQDGNLFCGNPKLEEKGSGMTAIVQNVAYV